MKHANLANAIGAAMILTAPCVQTRTGGSRTRPSANPGVGQIDRNRDGVHSGILNRGSARGPHGRDVPRPRRNKREAPAVAEILPRVWMAGYE